MPKLIAEAAEHNQFAIDGFQLTVVSPPEEPDPALHTTEFMWLRHHGSTVTIRTSSENRWVRLRGELWDSEPPTNTQDSWDRTSTMDLGWRHTALVIGSSQSQPGEVPNYFTVTPAAYKVRAYAAGVEGDERVLVQVWPRTP
ncbi:hypothetical protein [Streptomyces sp. NBC_01304]|uniref:hypothetical protein n=1 Tax=Streptomyces sp. NBC_01304 TaxID=2903818 RepID=UPI002E0E702D|nr:hypothetical protein OG430_33215 [Streptomyces sp. NBC_01304]